MNYKCRVLTPKFREILERALNELTSEKDEFLKDIAKQGWMITFRDIWGGGSTEGMRLALEDRYPGITTPEYTEVSYKQAENSIQTRARIYYNGEVRKIDEIPEIIAYELEKEGI